MGGRRSSYRRHHGRCAAIRFSSLFAIDHYVAMCVIMSAFVLVFVLPFVIVIVVILLIAALDS